MSSLFFSIIFILPMLTSCETAESNIKMKEVVTPKSIDLGYQDLKLKGEVSRHIDSANNSIEDIQSIGCEDWVIKDTQLQGVLKKMEMVDPVEWNSLCYNYPCFYTCVVSNDSVEYKMEINSASYIILSNDKETYRFIAREKLNIFLTPCNCCE